MCCGRQGRWPKISPSASRPAAAVVNSQAGREWIWLDFPRIAWRPSSWTLPMGCSWLPAAANPGGRGQVPAGAGQEGSARSPPIFTPCGRCRPGIAVTAPSSRGEDDFVSRYFAPWVGVDEDPGDRLQPLRPGALWAERLGKRQLRARQISARGGDLRLELQERGADGGPGTDPVAGEWLLPAWRTQRTDDHSSCEGFCHKNAPQIAGVLIAMDGSGVCCGPVSAALTFCGRKAGNRMTSRMVWLLVNSITRRSIPIP